MQEPPYILPPQRPHAEPEQADDGTYDDRVVPTRSHHECEPSTSVNWGMIRPMKSLLMVVMALVFCASAQHAEAAPAKKKYHFKLTKILVKPEVKPDVAKLAQARVEALFKKALDEHPQLVQALEGGPDPDKDAAAYRKWIAKKGISAAYLVTVEITAASQEIVVLEEKKNTQRIVVSLGLHVLGETIPGRTMGFTGDGAATVKQEIGMRVRDKDVQFTLDGAAETAINDALKTCFAKLAKPQKKQ